MNTINVSAHTPSNLSNFDLLTSIANERLQVSYRPEWREFTGSVTASILLRQILFRWEGNGRKPFYKFKLPCGSAMYKPGDSWCEELGFTEKEFDGALRRIAFKRSAKNKNTVNSNKPVEYWTDINRVTYYVIIPEIMEAKLESLYSSPSPPEFSKPTKQRLPVTDKTAVTNPRNQRFEYNQTIHSYNNNDVRKVEAPPPADPVPEVKEPSSSFSSHDLNDLMQAVPQERRSPDVEKRLQKALIAGFTVAYLLDCIAYSHDRSNGDFVGYLGNTIDKDYAPEGYHKGQTEKAERDRQKAVKRKEKAVSEAKEKQRQDEERERLSREIDNADALIESVDLDALDAFIDSQELKSLERYRFKQNKRLALRRRFVSEFAKGEMYHD